MTNIIKSDTLNTHVWGDNMKRLDTNNEKIENLKINVEELKKKHKYQVTCGVIYTVAGLIAIGDSLFYDGSSIMTVAALVCGVGAGSSIQSAKDLSQKVNSSEAELHLLEETKVRTR